MCGGGRPSAPDNSKALELQKKQMDKQTEQYKRSLKIQKRQYEEQKAVATAPPPPAPIAGAATAAPALEDAMAVAPSAIRMGYGRRRMRTDIAGATPSILSIPAV